MRLCKILLEIARSTSHMVEVPRYEVAVRRAVNPPGTKFKIHTRPRSSLTTDSFVEFDSWRDAWRDLRGRYSAQIITEVYDAVTFQDEFDATMARDGADVKQNPAELTHAEWEPLMKLDEVDETLAQSLHAEGLQSIYAVAAATLDELEAIPGLSVAKAVAIQQRARQLSEYTPETANDALEDEVAQLEAQIAAARAAAPDMPEGSTADLVDSDTDSDTPSPFDLPPGD